MSCKKAEGGREGGGGGGGRRQGEGIGGHEQHTLCKICCVSWIHTYTFLMNLVLLLYSKTSPFVCRGGPLAFPLVVGIGVGVAPAQCS